MEIHAFFTSKRGLFLPPLAASSPDLLVLARVLTFGAVVASASGISMSAIVRGVDCSEFSKLWTFKLPIETIKAPSRSLQFRDEQIGLQGTLSSLLENDRIHS